MTRITAYAFSFAGLEGSEIKLGDHAGKPILVVNTASLCGYTPQYAGLQQLWTRYHQRGLMIVGVPSNDFGGQEPGGAADIMRTAHGEYRIGFPLAAKAQVKGPNPHPYTLLCIHKSSKQQATYPGYVASAPHCRAMWIGLTESPGAGGTDRAAGC